MQRDSLTKHLHEYLNVEAFKDHGPNGLQVEGRKDIKKIITGVSAGVELFEKAIEKEADAIIVHHGVIWNFERPVYKGGYKKRIKLLLENDINLFAYHLPLDAHPEVGNNIVMAKILGLSDIQPFGDYNGQFVGFRGTLPETDAGQFISKIKAKINEQALIFPYGPPTIGSVGIISGGAQKNVNQAVEAGLDLYLTGEASEHILHYVKEEKIHFVAAGHHATERFGIRALGRHIQQKFNIDTEYVEIPNPV